MTTSNDMSGVSGIGEIVTGRVDWVIDVRVIRLWVVPQYRDSQIANTVEMILLDNKLDRIHATVKRSLLVRFHPILHEGGAYRIQKISVSANDSHYATTKHKFKLNFMATTACTPLKESDIPKNHFILAEFVEIEKSPEDGCLTDVIGHLVQRGDLRVYERLGRQTSYVQCVLEDTSRNNLQCTLWGMHAEEINTNLDNYGASSPPVVLLQLCKLKRFKGVMGISNAFYGTRVFFNSDIPEIHEYRLRMQTPSAELTQAVTQVAEPPQISLAEEMLETPRFSITDLLEATDVGFAGVIAQKYCNKSIDN